MKKKLVGQGDIKVILENASTKGNWIPPIEMSKVLTIVSDNAYVLYSFYRTFPFTEAVELDDTFVSKILNWSNQKTKRNRLDLQNNNLFRTVRYGTRTEGITKVFVGMDVVALFDAGMPAEILEPKALRKLKRQFNIETPADLALNAGMLVQAYENNPDLYN